MSDIAMRFNRDMLVVEGGMGFMFTRYGATNIDCPELYNATEPSLIEEIHKYFHLAGANCAISNTYGASLSKLTKLGLEDYFEDLNRRGIKLAKTCKPQHVLADMGQSAILVVDDESARDANKDYAKQAQILAKENPDAIYIETMASLSDALCAVEAVKGACDLPVICSCVYNQEGNLKTTGESIEECSDKLQTAGVDVLGMNCLLKPNEMVKLASRLVGSSSVPTMMCPDVEAPTRNRKGDLQYNGATDEMAKVAVEMRNAGVSLIGSCCGSTPAYTSAIFSMVGNMEVKNPANPS